MLVQLFRKKIIQHTGEEAFKRHTEENYLGRSLDLCDVEWQLSRCLLALPSYFSKQQAIHHYKYEAPFPVHKHYQPQLISCKNRGKETAEKSHKEGHPTKAFGWAARDQSGVLSPFNFSRRFHLTSLNFFCGPFFNPRRLITLYP